MTDGLLVVIAAAVCLTAVIQVAGVVFALRAARQVGDSLGRLEREIRPILDNLKTSSADLARATSLAKAQVERADRTIAGLAQRVDDVGATVQQHLLAPLRDGAALMAGIRTAIDVFRDFKRRPRRATPPPPPEGEDAMFIG